MAAGHWKLLSSSCHWKLQKIDDILIILEQIPSNIDQITTKVTSKNHGFSKLPSGNLTFCNGKIHPFLVGKLTISMAIFNSYFDTTRGFLWPFSIAFCMFTRGYPRVFLPHHKNPPRNQNCQLHLSAGPASRPRTEHFKLLVVTNMEPGKHIMIIMDYI